MPINDIKGSIPPGLPRPALGRPNPAPQGVPVQGARTREGNAASNALRSRTVSRSAPRASSKADTAQSAADSVCHQIASGAIELREGVSPAALSRIALMAANRLLDLRKAFPQLAA